MLKVWGRTTSVNVQKVLWALDEIGQAFEQTDVGGPFGGLDTPEFGSLNPARRIPVLQDGDFALWESGAIVAYLLETYGGDRVGPRNGRERALSLQWTDWCQFQLYRDIIVDCFMPLVRVPAAERNQSQVAAGARRAGEQLAILDAHLSGRTFIVGDRLTAADVVIGSLMHRYVTMPIERPALANVARWHQGLMDRHGFRTYIMVDWESMKVPGA
ncbi:MAG: glutathione S-transferase family protein [Hyphomicrobiaceae bacterium]|nr:glutathione S-transferase family protein [Hyphomicrobiaceae bacterium]